MANKKSFVLYYDTITQFELLSDEEAGKLIKAIYRFAVNDDLPDDELSPMTKMAFSFISTQLKRDKEKYIKRCKINAENSKKGGRPKTDSVFSVSKEIESFNSQPKKPDSDSENDNDNDNGNDSVNDSDSVSENKSVAESIATDNESADADYLTLGSQNNVFLSLREYTTLKQKYGEIADKKIQWLSEYMPTRDKNYKNHFILLDNWCMEEVLANKEKKDKQEHEKKRKQENKPAYDLDEFMRMALMNTPKHTSVGDGVLDIPK